MPAKLQIPDALYFAKCDGKTPVIYFPPFSTQKTQLWEIEEGDGD